MNKSIIIVTAILLVAIGLMHLYNCMNKERKIKCRILGKMIWDEKFLWLFMIINLVVFAMKAIWEIKFSKNDDLDNFIEGIAYSVIAAFIFYIFMELIPRVKKKYEDYLCLLNMLENINVFLNSYKQTIDDSKTKDEFVSGILNGDEKERDETFESLNFCLGIIKKHAISLYTYIPLFNENEIKELDEVRYCLDTYLSFRGVLKNEKPDESDLEIIYITIKRFDKLVNNKIKEIKKILA